MSCQTEQSFPYYFHFNMAVLLFLAMRLPISQTKLQSEPRRRHLRTRSEYRVTAIWAVLRDSPADGYRLRRTFHSRSFAAVARLAACIVSGRFFLRRNFAIICINRDVQSLAQQCPMARQSDQQTNLLPCDLTAPRCDCRRATCPRLLESVGTRAKHACENADSTDAQRSPQPPPLPPPN
jgi:hypothetical protein